jgi:hypothetical protein
VYGGISVAGLLHAVAAPHVRGRGARLAMTSGRSRKKVMPRKPSASHCVQKLPPDLYRPSRLVFSCARAGMWREKTAACGSHCPTCTGPPGSRFVPPRKKAVCAKRHRACSLSAAQ